MVDYETENDKIYDAIPDPNVGDPTQAVAEAIAWNERTDYLVDITGPLPGNDYSTATINSHKLGIPPIVVSNTVDRGVEPGIILVTKDNIPMWDGRFVVSSLDFRERMIFIEGVVMELSDGHGVYTDPEDVLPHGPHDEDLAPADNASMVGGGHQNAFIGISGAGTGSDRSKAIFYSGAGTDWATIAGGNLNYTFHTALPIGGKAFSGEVWIWVDTGGEDIYLHYSDNEAGPTHWNIAYTLRLTIGPYWEDSS